MDFALAFRIGNADFDLAAWARDFDFADGLAAATAPVSASAVVE
jgi:hypothetical protein